MEPPANGADFQHILDLARFITARVRKSPAATRRQRAALLARGEKESRIVELDQWRESSGFTPREKAALGLSEALSTRQSEEITAGALDGARKYFDSEETVSLSMAIMAMNEWLDLHSEPYTRVLVVEDSADDQELLRRQLRKSGMEVNVIFVPNADQALALLDGCQTALFDWALIAIFLDIGLPGMSGTELLQRIRSMSAVREVPVIVMTSSNNPRDLEECQRLGVSSYVQKPVTFNTFSKAVANIFHQTRDVGARAESAAT